MQGSAFKVNTFPSADKKYGLTNKIFDLHSHPLPSGINTYENSYQPSGGDFTRYKNHKVKFGEADKTMPNYYMIFAQTDMLVKYHNDGISNIYKNIKKITSYIDLMNSVK